MLGWGLGGVEHGAEEFVDGSGAQFGGDLAEALHDGIHRFIQRGGAGGDAHVAGGAKPGGIQFVSVFDLNRGQAVCGGFLHELTRVVAVAATNDDDVVTVVQQIVECRLALLGGMADRVDETYFRASMATFDLIHQTQGNLHRLRGL